VGSNVIRERVAGVDLHEVMDDNEREHAAKIDIRRHMLGERQGGKREVPRMFRRVLEARVVGEWRAPDDRFQLVGFEKERDLLCETIRIRHLKMDSKSAFQENRIKKPHHGGSSSVSFVSTVVDHQFQSQPRSSIPSTIAKPRTGISE
jgi:hypothetical protein